MQGMQGNDWGLPEPPGVRPAGFNPWRWIVTALFGAILLFLSFVVPIPIFYAYIPGPAPEVDGLVKINDARTYSSEGTFLMTTVSVDTQVTFAEMVFSAFDPDKAIVQSEAVTGGSSLKELQREQEQQMKASNRASEEVALAALGFGKPKGDGARVRATFEGSPASEFLERGDVIVSVDGRRVDTTCDVGRAIDEHEVGDIVTLSVRRDGERKTFELDTIRNPEDPGAPFLGVAMQDVNYRFTPGVNVDFDTGDIAGPSAGLIFALSLYDQLTPDDLTGGRKVAGTGTIDCDGGVGPIGGVEQKVAGAEQKGAEVFLSPVGNVAAARGAADDIQVVAISNFTEALEYLEGRN